MHFNDSTSIINLIVLGIHVFVQLAAAILIYIKHHEPQNRSWKYIFVFFVVSAIASTVEIALVANQEFAPQSYKLLDPLINIPGFYIFAILLCYIIELLHPHWLNFKRILLLFLPSMICAAVVLLFVMKGQITSLCSMSIFAKTKSAYLQNERYTKLSNTKTATFKRDRCFFDI